MSKQPQSQVLSRHDQLVIWYLSAQKLGYSQGLHALDYALKMPAAGDNTFRELQELRAERTRKGLPVDAYHKPEELAYYGVKLETQKPKAEAKPADLPGVQSLPEFERLANENKRLYQVAIDHAYAKEVGDPSEYVSIDDMKFWQTLCRKYEAEYQARIPKAEKAAGLTQDASKAEPDKIPTADNPNAGEAKPEAGQAIPLAKPEPETDIQPDMGDFLDDEMKAMIEARSNDPLPEPKKDQAGQEGKPEAKPRIAKLYSCSDYCQAPKLEWALKGLLPARGVGQIFGAPSSLKSFFAISMLMAIADKDVEFFYGHRVRHKPVVYIVLEGEEGFILRLMAYKKYMQKIKPDWDFPQEFHLIKGAMEIDGTEDKIPIDLGTQETVSILSNTLPKGAIVCFDTQSAATSSLDENQELGIMIEAMKAIARAINGFLLTIHHTGWGDSKRARGDSKQFGAWDFSLIVAKENDDGLYSWKSNKVKDGKEGDKRYFNREVVPLWIDEDGDQVDSCVAIPCREIPAITKRIDNQIEKLKADKAYIVFLELFEQSDGKGVPRAEWVKAWSPFTDVSVDVDGMDEVRAKRKIDRAKDKQFSRICVKLLGANLVSESGGVYKLPEEELSLF